MINEIRLIIRERKEYFKQFYSYIELIIIAFSWSAFAMYIYRLYSSYKIFDSLKKSKKNDNGLMDVSLNLQYLSYCNDLLFFFMGICASFGTIRFIKLLRFSKRVVVFILAFKSSFNELLSFIIISFIFWLGFVQFFYFIFHDKTKEFSTLVSCMETLFQVILGKFEVRSIINANPFFGSLFFIIYNIMVVFVLASFFVSILLDYFSLIRTSNDLDKNDPEIIEYIKSLIYPLFGLDKNEKKKSYTENKNLFNLLDKKIDDLIAKLYEAREVEELLNKSSKTLKKY
jgi:hypothetical protein